MKYIVIAAALLLQEAPNKPKSCDNSYANTHKCECAMTKCDRKGASSPDAKCKTYCSPSKCKCASPCST